MSDYAAIASVEAGSSSGNDPESATISAEEWEMDRLWSVSNSSAGGAMSPKLSKIEALGFGNSRSTSAFIFYF